MSERENRGQPVSDSENVEMITPRKTFYAKIVKLLREKGGHTEEEMVKAIKPPTKQLRTFDRAVKDLQKFEIVTEEDEENRVYLIGHEAKDIGISIGVRPLKVDIPFEKGAAKRLLNKRPVLKHLITRREGLIYEILTGAGMLDKNTSEDRQ